MMRNRFWQGMIWGSVMGTVLGALMGPMMRPKKKPLMERSAVAIRDTTRDLMTEARHARKRIMKKFD